MSKMSFGRQIQLPLAGAALIALASVAVPSSDPPVPLRTRRSLEVTAGDVAQPTSLATRARRPEAIQRKVAHPDAAAPGRPRPQLGRLLAVVTERDVGQPLVRAERASLERLVAALARDPELAWAVRDRLRTLLPTPRQRRLLLTALSQAGTDTAERALLELARLGTIRRSAIRALGRSVGSLVEVDRFLSRTYEQSSSSHVGRAALESLGGRLRRLAGRDVNRADRIAGYLSDRLDAARTPAERRALIRAVGNGGDARHLEVVAGALESPDPWDRGDAVRALRFMDDPRVERLLIERFRGDASPRVRHVAGAILAARARPEELPGLLGAMRGQPMGVVRAIAATLSRAATPALIREMRSAMATTDHEEGRALLRHCLMTGE